MRRLRRGGPGGVAGEWFFAVIRDAFCAQEFGSSVIGYDAAGFHINDPAGDWYKCYGCDTSGKGLHIDYGSPFDRKLGADGDMWLSAASKVAFDPFP